MEGVCLYAEHQTLNCSVQFRIATVKGKVKEVKESSFWSGKL